jgi:isocitrate/isopropylmalate dehydrogenase
MLMMDVLWTGSGVKSINVTARKVWNTYANKRVFQSMPGVNTIFSRAKIPIDITLIRENIEDTYGTAGSSTEFFSHFLFLFDFLVA